MKLWFVMDSAPFTADMLRRLNTDALGGGVGGAETMTVGLARQLATRGHDVTIWATQLEAAGRYGPVLWRSVESGLRHALIQEPSPDVVISVRRPELFMLPEFAGLPIRKVLWAQDVLLDWQGMPQQIRQADALIYVSEWQRQEWIRLVPDLAGLSSWVTPIAYDPEWLREAPRLKRRRDRYIYASRPERGLEPLLMMWPKILAELPTAQLVVTGYTQGVDIERADRLIGETPNVVIRRGDNKWDFFGELSGASLLLYPGETWFHETNGSVCTQAMAAGVIPLVSRRGALVETVPELCGVLFDGDPRSGEYQAAFIQRVIALSSPDADEEVAVRQVVGREHVKGCEYATVTDGWEKALSELCQASPSLA